jgi:hypothetical protein
MKSVVIWHEAIDDGSIEGKAVLCENVVFENDALPCKLTHTRTGVWMSALRVMEYSTLQDGKCGTLMIGDTAHVPFNERVWTQSAPSGLTTFTVYKNPLMVIRTDEYMHVCIMCGQSIVVGQVRAYYNDTLKVLVDKIKRRFISSGTDVEDYRFSTVDYASSVSVRYMKFMPDRTTFGSAFGNAKTGVLYAYWRHEDKPVPRKLVDKKREIADKKREVNVKKMYVSQYFDEPEYSDETT